MPKLNDRVKYTAKSREGDYIKKLYFFVQIKIQLNKNPDLPLKKIATRVCLNSPQFEVFKNEPCGPSSPKNCQNGTRSGSHPNSSSQKAPMHNSLVQITILKFDFFYLLSFYFNTLISFLNFFSSFLFWAFIAPVTSTQILATESLQTRRRPHYHPKISHLPKIHLFQ